MRNDINFKIDATALIEFAQEIDAALGLPMPAHVRRRCDKLINRPPSDLVRREIVGDCIILELCPDLAALLADVRRITRESNG